MTEIVVVGFGGRGQEYSAYAKKEPDKMKIVAVAEPKAFLREKAAKEYGIPEENLFESYEELFRVGRPLGDGIFITTQDNDHIEPSIMAMECGYRNLMVEKPIDRSMDECRRLLEAGEKYGAKIQVCHTLRYTPFYRKMKEIVDSGILGKIMHINQEEGVGYYHFAHSFIRGDWGNEEASSPMILAKCCHDMDLLQYLMGEKPVAISSMGDLTYFKKENAPEGSTARCIDCPVAEECPYNAVRIYTENEHFRNIGVDKEGFSDIETAMREGRYGRCVYRCDNTVVDHQSVNIRFEGGATASLTMNGFTHLINRETRIMGTLGELYGDMEESIIRVCPFGKEEIIYTIDHADTNHSGGDEVLSADFVRSIEEPEYVCTDIKESIVSHDMCRAAEESRKSGREVPLEV